MTILQSIRETLEINDEIFEDPGGLDSGDTPKIDSRWKHREERLSGKMIRDFSEKDGGISVQARFFFFRRLVTAQEIEKHLPPDLKMKHWAEVPWLLMGGPQWELLGCWGVFWNPGMLGI